MSYEFEGLFVSQGWQCPICKRVYSPYMSMCMYCGNGKQAYTVSTGTEHIHTPDGKIGVTDVYPGFIPPISDLGNSKTAPNDVPITK